MPFARRGWFWINISLHVSRISALNVGMVLLLSALAIQNCILFVVYMSMEMRPISMNKEFVRIAILQLLLELIIIAPLIHWLSICLIFSTRPNYCFAFFAGCIIFRIYDLFVRSRLSDISLFTLTSFAGIQLTKLLLFLKFNETTNLFFCYSRQTVSGFTINAPRITIRFWFIPILL